MKPIIVNRAFTGQRVTGQQRYATEVARRLEASPEYRSAEPAGFWARSTLRTWAWVQVVLPFLARGSVVLSMTSRAPLWCRRHVLVVHDLFVLTHPEWYSRRYVWTHAPLLRMQIRSAAAVVAVSRPVADELAAYRSEPVEVAPNAPSDVFSEHPGGPDDAALVSRGLVADGYFLAVGSKDPRKNLPRLAAAYGRLTSDDRRAFPLVVVGASNAIFADETLTWPLGTVDAGYVTDDELRQLYRHTRCVVFVSLAEGFGLPLVEAAAAGTRGVLASDIPVFRWICENQVRYVDPRSVHDVSAALYREIQESQRQTVELATYSWELTAGVIGRICRRERSPDRSLTRTERC